MSWQAVGGAVVGLAGSLYSSNKASDATGDASDATAASAAEDRALNIKRYDEAQRMMSPYIQRADIAQQQLMSELGLPVPSQSPYMQQQQLEIDEKGVEDRVRQQLLDRGIPEFITEKTHSRQSGRSQGSGVTSVQVENPAFQEAARSERAKIRQDMSIGGERTTSMGMDQPIEGEYIPAPGSGYRATDAYKNQMGMYDEYSDIIGTPSYDAIKDPLRDYQKLVEADSVRAPIEAYQRMVDEGIDVTNLPGYQKLMDERLSAVNQGAVGAGSLYSGRRGEALAEVGGAQELAFSRDYMSQQRDVAGMLSSVEQARLAMQGNIARGMSGIETGRMDRFSNITSAKAGTENQFYTNYMNMLQNMGSSKDATNLSALGVNQGIQMGSQNMAATNQGNAYNLMGAGAENAALADMAKGGANIASAYMNRPPPPPTMIQNSPIQQPAIMPTNAGYTNVNYSPMPGATSSPVSQPDYMSGF